MTTTKKLELIESISSRENYYSVGIALGHCYGKNSCVEVERSAELKSSSSITSYIEPLQLKNNNTGQEIENNEISATLKM